MRILVDEEEIQWDAAWNIVTNTFFFTNHTVLPVSVLTFWTTFQLTHVISLGSAGEVAGSVVAASASTVRCKDVDSVLETDFIVARSSHMQLIFDIVSASCLAWIMCSFCCRAEPVRAGSLTSCCWLNSAVALGRIFLQCESELLLSSFTAR